tara:strand:+ start:1077 stop:1844 length:768 start_codon:yes stop_codon:yes gene_type:complete
MDNIKHKKLSLLNRVIFLMILSVSVSKDADHSQIAESFITFAGVKFHIISNGSSPNRYIWLHGDEKTAKMALEYHIKKYSGSAFFIENDTREIPFKSTIIDPNRIFSRNGSYHTLRKFKPGWAPGTLKKALDELDVQRSEFMNVLMPSKGALLISLHNNFRGYNVYKEKNKSQRTSIKTNENPRDFMICTDEKDFEKLAVGPYNVVLQNKLPDNDDGSLSWEALRRNIRYLNIETRLGYLSKQKKMLRFVEENLD